MLIIILLIPPFELIPNATPLFSTYVKFNMFCITVIEFSLIFVITNHFVNWSNIINVSINNVNKIALFFIYITIPLFVD